MTTSLAELDVLAVDCQATAAHPAKGHLLEIGWSDVRASEPVSPAVAALVRLPRGVEIPRRVQRVTGLDEATLARGRLPEDVGSSFVETARTIARRNRMEQCTTIIHYSRFETPYLRWLEARAGTSFPLSIVCTHEIVKRLLPALPRRGLRAVAGYFGHSVSEMRRAEHHVAATVAVWRAAVLLLAEKAGVCTVEDLDAWLKTPHSRRERSRDYPMSPKQRRAIPDHPGIYKMLAANGDVLYVGKATSLKRRVGSYFRERAPHAEHILEMLTQARDIALTVTGSALEAALEESDAIKKLSPPYNKALRRRERTIVFATRMLDEVAPSPDEAHRLGPLPSGELWSALSSMKRDRMEALPGEALAVPAPYAPEAATYRAGLELFLTELGTMSLLARGARLWRESLEDAPEEEFQLKLQYDEGVERWTPEGVANRLNEIVARACHLVRRAHWLCLLSESTLVWEEPGTGEIALVIQNGRLRSRHTRVEPSAGFVKPFDERRSSFDLDTYDRLTVLTKEIRRLASEGRPVRVVVGRHAVLEGDKLRSMLRWI